MASPTCGKCKKHIFYEDENIQCDGNCKAFFHKKCASITDSDYSNYYSGKSSWFCAKACSMPKLNKSPCSSVSSVVGKLNKLYSKINSIGGLLPEITKIKSEIVQFDQQPSASVHHCKPKEEDLKLFIQKVDKINKAVTQILENKIQVGTLIINEIPYDIYKGENVIGRSELSDIVLRSNSISSKHAVVEVEDWDTHLIFDCGSTNKTRLGKVFLKPNVRYNLQGGEDIMFADFKAKYIKLDKPQTAQEEDEDVSDAGSESLLNSVPADLEADLNIVNNDQPTKQLDKPEAAQQEEDNISDAGSESLLNSVPAYLDEDLNLIDDNLPISQAQNNPTEDASHAGSDLNDSSLLEENKYKPSSSRLQVVDASDDSTDDEGDFIPPSQTVKEFASKKQLSLKKKCLKETSSDMFSNEIAVMNTQAQDMMFMTENPDCNKISNSLNVNTQSWFSSEVQESAKPKVNNIFEQSIFEAETQESDFALNRNEPGSSSRVSRDIFDAETEIPGVTAPADDVEMSDLQLSNALTQPCLLGNKTESSTKDKVKEEYAIRPLVEEKPPLDILDATTSSSGNSDNEEILNACTQLNIHDSKSVSNNSDKVKEELQIRPFVEVKPPVNIADSATTSDCDEENEDIFNACTQANPSLKVSPLLNVVKQEISIKPEPEEDICSEETQVNFNLQGKSRTRQSSHTKMDVQEINNEGDETQPNILLVPFCKVKADEVLINDAQPDHANEHGGAGDSDNTDVDDDLNQPLGQVRNVNSAPKNKVEDGDNIPFDKKNQDKSTLKDQRDMNTDSCKQITTNNSKTNEEHENDGNSNDSDSLLAAVPLDFEDIDLVAPQPKISNESEKRKESINCKSQLKSCQTLSQEDSNKKHQELTVGEMDICSTVGDGTYLSACGSTRKPQNDSKVVNNLQTSSKKITSESVDVVADQKKVSETESLNHSMIFNEPCGSSTPFTTNEKVIVNNKKNINAIVVKTPPRALVERVEDSPDLPLTEELVEVACKTPERQNTTPARDSRSSINLPLALKRTPRARKLSRKVAEALEEGEISLPLLSVSKSKSMAKEDIVSHKVKDEENSHKIHQGRKQVKRKPDNQQKDSPEAPEEKSDHDLLKQNNCVKKLSVSLTDVSCENEINEQPPAKSAKSTKIEESPCESDVRSEGSKKCSIKSKLEEIIGEDISDTSKSSEVEKSNRAGVNKTLPKKDLPSETSKNDSKPEHLNVDLKVSTTNNDEHVTPPKPSKIVEKPSSTLKNNLKGNKNSKNENQKSVVEVVGDTTQDSSTIKISKNENRQHEPSKRENNDATGKLKESKNVHSPTKIINTTKTSPEKIRKSSRRKNVNVKSNSDKEPIDDRKPCNSMKPAPGLRIKSKSKDNLTESEVITRKSKRKEEKSNTENEASVAETQNKLLNENNPNLNRKDNIKAKVILLDESVKDKMNKTKAKQELKASEDVLLENSNTAGTDQENLTRYQKSSRSRVKLSRNCNQLDAVVEKTLNTKSNFELKDSKDDNLENLNIADTDQENLTTTKKPSRSRVKPARYREKEEINDSDSSCVFSHKGSSSSKRRMGRHNSTNVEDKNSTPPEDKNNTDESEFVEPSKSIVCSDEGPSSSKRRKGRHNSTSVEGRNSTPPEDKNNKDKSQFVEPSKSIPYSDKGPSSSKRRKEKLTTSTGVDIGNPTSPSENNNDESGFVVPSKSIPGDSKGLSSSKKGRHRQQTTSEESGNETCEEDKNSKDKSKFVAPSISIPCDSKAPSISKRRRGKHNSTCTRVESGNPTTPHEDNKDDTGFDAPSPLITSNDKVPSSSKRLKKLHEPTSVESGKSSTPRKDNKSNRDKSGFVASSTSVPCDDNRKHSEIFKTPVVEDRSRTSGRITSRSRSRSNSSQGSLTNDISSLHSPRRSGARGKCVLFSSGLMNPTLESQVRRLGGSVVDCPLECSLLVADKVRRTVKFLCVLGQGKPIVPPDWITQSWQCTRFIEPMDQLLEDREAEERFGFSLARTLQAARAQPLLQGYHLHATPSVKPPPPDIKSIVECCGGEYLEKVPSKWPENTIVISHVEDKSLWKKLKVKGVTPPIVATEMLLIGVLQHKLEVEPHRIT